MCSPSTTTRPPEAANASVRYIVDRVAIGRFVRGIHFWAAQAMYVLAALHLLRVFTIIVLTILEAVTTPASHLG